METAPRVATSNGATWEVAALIDDGFRKREA
jgi:hypothetical protein